METNQKVSPADKVQTSKNQFDANRWKKILIKFLNITAKFINPTLFFLYSVIYFAHYQDQD